MHYSRAHAFTWSTARDLCGRQTHWKGRFHSNDSTTVQNGMVTWVTLTQPLPLTQNVSLPKTSVTRYNNNNNHNNNRELIERFRKLKALYNLNKNIQCANTHKYTNRWYTSVQNIRKLTNISIQSTHKGGRGCLMSPSCLESQGCYLIPLSYLLSCLLVFSA